MKNFTLVKRYDNGMEGYMQHITEGSLNRKITAWLLISASEHISGKANNNMQAWQEMDKVAKSYGATPHLNNSN